MSCFQGRPFGIGEPVVLVTEEHCFSLSRSSLDTSSYLSEIKDLRPLLSMLALKAVIIAQAVFKRHICELS